MMSNETLEQHTEASPTTSQGEAPQPASEGAGEDAG